MVHIYCHGCLNLVHTELLLNLFYAPHYLTLKFLKMQIKNDLDQMGEIWTYFNYYISHITAINIVT